MKSLIAFALGVLAGWFANKNMGGASAPPGAAAPLPPVQRAPLPDASAPAHTADLEQTIARQQQELDELRARLASALAELEATRAGVAELAAAAHDAMRTVAQGGAEGSAAEESAAESGAGADVDAEPDDLTAINGVGPAIARILNEAGVRTWDEVAALSEDRLRELLGETIARVADEERIIEHARALADARGEP